MISEIRNCSALETPSQNAAQSLMMVVTSKPNDIYESFLDEVRKYNKEPPFMFQHPDILNNLRQFVEANCPEATLQEGHVSQLQFHLPLKSTR